jgi:hypothetical protein
VVAADAALWKFNGGKVRCPDSPERAQQPALREKRVTQVHNSREEMARESEKCGLKNGKAQRD